MLNSKATDLKQGDLVLRVHRDDESPSIVLSQFSHFSPRRPKYFVAEWARLLEPMDPPRSPPQIMTSGIWDGEERGFIIRFSKEDEFYRGPDAILDVLEETPGFAPHAASLMTQFYEQGIPVSHPTPDEVDEAREFWPERRNLAGLVCSRYFIDPSGESLHVPREVKDGEVRVESYDIRTGTKSGEGPITLAFLSTMTIAPVLQARRILGGKGAQIPKPKPRSVHDLRRSIFPKPLPKKPGQTNVGSLQPGDEDIEL